MEYDIKKYSEIEREILIAVGALAISKLKDRDDIAQAVFDSLSPHFSCKCKSDLKVCTDTLFQHTTEKYREEKLKQWLIKIENKEQEIERFLNMKVMTFKHSFSSAADLQVMYGIDREKKTIEIDVDFFDSFLFEKVVRFFKLDFDIDLSRFDDENFCGKARKPPEYRAFVTINRVRYRMKVHDGNTYTITLEPEKI